MRKSLRLIFLPLMVLSGLFLASCAEEEKGTEEVVDINGLSDIRLSYDGSENARSPFLPQGLGQCPNPEWTG